MRRLTASLVASLVTASALLTQTHSPAQAQTNYAELLTVVNGNVASADCTVLGGALRGAGLVSADTTRGGLVSTLNKAVGEDPALRLVAGGTVNAIGDRALACGVVKADPVTPIDQAVTVASQLSSRAGLPQLRDILPALR